jgi:2-polyprenyl-6-methoxyphenol hydroxylase-like FAD-dependent oxidoreductase
METPMTTPHALIIGGSLGGLFAATTLRAAGWEVDIFERSPGALDSRGGGIVLQADVLAAFDFAGIVHPQALGVASGDRIYLDRHDRVIQRSFMPQTQTSWNLLYTTMTQALPAERIHAGESLLRVEQHADGVRAHFASGRVASGDLLIAADGGRSTVRSQLLPGLAPRYAGYVAWRGLAPEAQVSDRAMAKLAGTFAFQQGDGHLLLAYLVPGEDGSTRPGARRWNWVWYRPVADTALPALMTDRDGREHGFSLPPGAAKDDDIALLREAAGALLAPSFQDLVAATEAPFVQAILDLQSPQMVFDRVVLLGDAAFIPRPHTAGSSAKAAADALALAHLLRPSDAPLSERLAAWQATRLWEGRNMTQWGMEIGDRLMGLGSARTRARA